MRLWTLALLLLLVAPTSRAADVCPGIRSQQSAADPATRIAAVACNEHIVWYRPFIDRDGRIASTTVTESERSVLGDGYTEAWQRVVGYWQQSGLLRQMGGSAGASVCAYASGERPLPACRGFVIDTPWSAAFVSWVMVKAGVPGFRPSASHINYVRAAAVNPQDSAYRFVDPATARPAPGDMLCYVRVRGQTYGYEGLLAAVHADGGGLPMHCDIVVAANPGNDATAYLIGGNVQQGVTMRLLPLNRNGQLWALPMSSPGALPCSPDNEDACSFNRQDWAVLLKLKSPDLLAGLPPPTRPVSAPILPTTQTPACCVNCVLGSNVPRCPVPPAH